MNKDHAGAATKVTVKGRSLYLGAWPLSLRDKGSSRGMLDHIGGILRDAHDEGQRISRFGMRAAIEATQLGVAADYEPFLKTSAEHLFRLSPGVRTIERLATVVYPPTSNEAARLSQLEKVLSAVDPVLFVRGMIACRYEQRHRTPPKELSLSGAIERLLAGESLAEQSIQDRDLPTDGEETYGTYQFGDLASAYGDDAHDIHQNTEGVSLGHSARKVYFRPMGTSRSPELAGVIAQLRSSGNPKLRRLAAILSEIVGGTRISDIPEKDQRYLRRSCKLLEDMLWLGPAALVYSGRTRNSGRLKNSGCSSWTDVPASVQSTPIQSIASKAFKTPISNR